MRGSAEGKPCHPHHHGTPHSLALATPLRCSLLAAQCTRPESHTRPSVAHILLVAGPTAALMRAVRPPQPRRATHGLQAAPLTVRLIGLVGAMSIPHNARYAID